MMQDIDNWRRSLSAIVPNVEGLRRQPRRWLRHDTIVIRAAWFPIWSLLCGFFVSIPLAWCVFTPLGMLAAQWLPLEPNAVMNVLMPVIYLSGVAIANFWLRWRRIEIAAEGVKFYRRRRHVFCPWQLFQANAGAPRVEEKGASVAVNPQGWAGVHLKRAGRTVREGAAALNGDLSSLTPERLMLQDMYEVRALPILGLLVDLANGMEAGPVDEMHSGR